ncbi:MAG: ATPase, T2SS/T4P/T4SS family [Myxococcota bacterium]
MIPAEAFRQTLRELFAPIVTHLENANVTEVLINGPREIYVEEHGRLHRTGDAFVSEAALLAAIRNLAQSVGRDIGRHTPVLEARFLDQAHVQVVVPPAAPSGPVLSIRRLPEVAATLDNLTETGVLGPVASGILRQTVFRRCNVLIVGSSGPAKTTVLTALASIIDPSERVVVLEERRQLRLTLPHLIRLEATSGSRESFAPLGQPDLLPAALRLRPDRLLVGEIRGAEALNLVRAMRSGLRGCLATLSAATLVEGLRRLEALAFDSDPRSDRQLIRHAVASAIDVVVEVVRSSEGAPVVSRISNLEPDESVIGYFPRDLFVSDPTSPVPPGKGGPDATRRVAERQVGGDP